MTRIGTVLSIGDPVMAELAAQALDLVWIDLEHGALSARDAQVLALAVQSTGAQAYVRVPSGRFDALPAILDAGVDGIVVPSVESAGQARELVRRMSCPLAGERGFGPRRAGCYGRTPDVEPRPACVVQICSPAGTGPARHVASLAAGRAEFVLVSADVRIYAAGVDAEAEALRAALEAVRAPA